MNSLKTATLENGKNCLLLDVVPTLDGKSFTIYDVTLYLRASNGIDRKRMLHQAALTIKGNALDVLIIDYHDSLDYETAKKLAIWYVSGGHSEAYRLD